MEKSQEVRTLNEYLQKCIDEKEKNRIDAEIATHALYDIERRCIQANDIGMIYTVACRALNELGVVRLNPQSQDCCQEAQK